ncbi:MAG: hypothetical protein JXA36_06710 [Coriobacteriia bacterium]|nr:hypothetical protein [Coriobacteriia bacterium]
MEESNGTAAAPNRTTVILLGVIVVLLLAIVGYFAFAGNGGTADDAADTGTAETTGMTGTTTEVEFDPATAVKVPEGQTPEQYVSAYFDAVVAGDFATAYAMLPTAKQAEYGSEAAFTTQLTGYGVTAYTIDDFTEEGEEARVTATASMPGGNFQYLWTFVKEGEVWLVKSRTLPGMGQ